jgi:hypothetical protein
VNGCFFFLNQSLENTAKQQRTNFVCRIETEHLRLDIAWFAWQNAFEGYLLGYLGLDLFLVFKLGCSTVNLLSILTCFVRHHSFHYSMLEIVKWLEWAKTTNQTCSVVSAASCSPPQQTFPGTPGLGVQAATMRSFPKHPTAWEWARRTASASWRTGAGGFLNLKVHFEDSHFYRNIMECHLNLLNLSFVSFAWRFMRYFQLIT